MVYPAHWNGVCRIYATAVVGLLAAGAAVTEAASTGERSLTAFKGFSSRFDKNGAPPAPLPASKPTATQASPGYHTQYTIT